MKITDKQLRRTIRENLENMLSVAVVSADKASFVSPTAKSVEYDGTLISNVVEEPLACLRSLHAILRAQNINYQTSHWQVDGITQYGNHELFQRLYESVISEIDDLGEKMVSYFGEDAVNMLLEIAEIHECLENWSQTRDHYERGLLSEMEVQTAIEDVYESYCNVKMSRGLDDFLAGIANNHETNIYLLKQILSK